MRRNKEPRRRIGEERFNELLAEKMEWEYRFQELESSYMSASSGKRSCVFMRTQEG